MIRVESQKFDELSTALNHGSYCSVDSDRIQPLSIGASAALNHLPVESFVTINGIPFHRRQFSAAVQHGQLFLFFE